MINAEKVLKIITGDLTCWIFASGKDKQYHTAEFAARNVPQQGHTATGGVISEYIDPSGNIYKAHVFTSTSSFNVESLGNIDIL